MEIVKQFYEEEDGSFVVDLVMAIAVLMCVALLFRKQFYNFAEGIMNKVFKQEIVNDVSENG